MFAIVYAEPDASIFSEALEAASMKRLSAATYVELGVVVDRLHDPVATGRLDDFMRLSEMVIEPVTAQQARIARQAYRDYGKASRHPARLNFGDCFAYALAKERGEPLLYKGSDFALTDIQSALNEPHR